MALKRRPNSDKLPISQRIDSRMANPGRRQMRPTEWEIKGELFMNCSCEVVCPCGISLGKHPPTYGYCQTWFAMQIDSGHFEGEPLDGLNVALLPPKLLPLLLIALLRSAAAACEPLSLI